jgi:hypothetical protein
MKRYFLNFTNGAEYLDQEGTELASLDEARAQAAIFCAEALRDADRAFWSGEPWRVWVTDEHGATVCTINLSSTPDLTLSPAGSD